MAAQQHLGDIQAFERPRSGILRTFKEPVLEAFFTQALGLPQHTRNQPYARLDRHQGRRLATGERVVGTNVIEASYEALYDAYRWGLLKASA